MGSDTAAFNVRANRNYSKLPVKLCWGRIGINFGNKRKRALGC